MLLTMFLIGIGYFIFSSKLILASEDKDISPSSSTNVQINNTEELVSKGTGKNDITFVLPEGYKFSEGTNSTVVTIEDGQKLTDEMIPVVELNSQKQSLKGWSLNGETLTKEQLLEIEVSEGMLLTAVIKSKSTGRSAKSVDTSIQSTIAGADQTKLIVVPDPSGGGANYKEYASTDAGLKIALADLYANGNGGEFVIYIGTNFTALTATTAKVIPASVNATNATFYALQGKVSSLILTGHSTDPIDNTNTKAVTGQKTLTLQNSFYLGTNLTIRNLNYNGPNLFMNGNSLNLNGGSFGGGWNVYGGSDTTDVTASPKIIINSTGSGTWNFYGGNSKGGILTGDTQMIINNTSGNIATISGGAKEGTIKGNVTVDINNAGGIIGINSGGVGTATDPANVEGDVNTTVNVTNSSTKMQLSGYIGGVSNGNISGTIKNTVAGYGKLSGNVIFVGGSINGDIGSDSEILVIKNDLDISNYLSSTLAEFVGANNGNGTIRGNVENYLRSGPVTGDTRIWGIHGLGGADAPRLTQAMIQGTYVASNSNTTMDAYDRLSTAEKIAIVEQVAKFKVYGNVETWLLGGKMGSSGGTNMGFTKGAGYGGMIIGDSTIHVGTANPDGSVGGDGFVSTRAFTDLSYSPAKKDTGANSAWDLVAGGGQDAATWQMFKVGQNNTIINNAAVRWTYSGGGSGVYIGNNTITLNGGFLDTLEGNGYMVQRHYGDTEAIVNGGQVDWFATPGGWLNVKRIGNGKMTVNKGVINAHIGATYQEGDVFGKSEMIVKGGDFSGNPRGSNTKMFSGGPNQAGNLHGSSELTIDFRNYSGDFKVPAGSFISAGLASGSTGSLGETVADSATLNIYTKPGVDSLQGSTIYGTVGTAASNKIGSIYMNIDAPDSSLGDLFAWDQSNVAGSAINKNVEVNLKRAKSVGTISGGNNVDNFTNTIVNNKPEKKVIFNIGSPLPGEQNPEYQTTPIDLTSGGLKNFTELNIDNGIMVSASGGNIRNGGGATAANHGTTYNGFGKVTLKNGGGIGVSSTNGYISVGDVTTIGESKIESRAGAGIINLTSLNFADADSRLNWIKLANGAATVQSTGKYWGSTQAYQVLTFNPTVANATAVTPFNFIGIEKDTGKTLLGDSDTTKSTSGYGIAIPGSIIDYQIINPIKEGTGDIKHDVSQVKIDNTPLPLAVWGSEVAGIPVQKGRLVIPASSNILPKLTFTPETMTTGSWLYNATIATTKIGDAATVIPEQNGSNSVDWKSPNADYSYNIKVQYSNQVELSLRNIILKESEAALVTNKTDINNYTEAAGRPFLTDDIDAAKILEINKPLDPGQVSRTVQVNYTSGTTAANTLSKTASIVIVKDTASVSTNRYVAVYGEDTSLKLEQANGLPNQLALESQYTKAVAILADGTQKSPNSDVATFTEIKNTTSDQLPKSVDIDYSYSSNGDTASKKITVLVGGILEILEVPTSMEFGEQAISNKEQVIWPTINGNLIVSDTRGSGRQPWSMRVKELTPLTSGSNTLTNALKYKDGGVEQSISGSDIVIETYSPTTDGTRVLTDDWGKVKNKGIKLVVPVKNQRLGNYSGTLNWSLVDAPVNE